MKFISNPKRKEWKELLSRPMQDFEEIEAIIDPIMRKVKRKGDKSLRKFTLEYDHVELEDLMVSRNEIEEAEGKVDRKLKIAIQQAMDNIYKFHEAQRDEILKVETMPGVVCTRKSVPISKVGLYIPGGTAPLFSTVLMLGIPANIAGCDEIIICTPPNHSGKINPVILYSANLIGIDKIVKVGGAQAIAAMAYGTESVPQVDKIFGPGNQYVTAAKQFVSRHGVAIDMPAGPSELLVYADESAKPEFVAADLLSQAEHGVDSQVLLVSEDENFITKVIKEVDKQIVELPRKEIAKKAIANSLAILTPSRSESIDLINEFGPEHLILSVNNADEVAEKVINAGSVFIGNYSPESAGDYASGTNHTLPTNGYARAFSGVSLDSFVKKITFQKLTEDGIKALGPSIEVMAEAEQLMAHKNAVSIRLKYLNGNV